MRELAEGLLVSFRQAPLVDAYDVYQHLMEFWADTFQDDAYLIADAGWVTAVKPRLIIDPKDEPDFAVGRQSFKSDLVPAGLLIARHFAAEQGVVESLEAGIAKIEQRLADMAEEHGGEGGLLEDVVGDNGKITKQAIAARLKALAEDDADELSQLLVYKSLLSDLATSNTRLKAAQAQLDERLAALYGALGEDEIKSVVVDDKWLAHVEASVQQELHRVSRTLASRTTQLASRYAEPLQDLADRADQAARTVMSHLERMSAG